MSLHMTIRNHPPDKILKFALVAVQRFFAFQKGSKGVYQFLKLDLVLLNKVNSSQACVDEQLSIATSDSRLF